MHDLAPCLGSRVLAGFPFAFFIFDLGAGAEGKEHDFLEVKRKEDALFTEGMGWSSWDRKGKVEEPSLGTWVTGRQAYLLQELLQHQKWDLRSPSFSCLQMWNASAKQVKHRQCICRGKPPYSYDVLCEWKGQGQWTSSAIVGVSVW